MTSPRRINPWVAFAIGALVAVLVAFAWMGWTRHRDDARHLTIRVPRPELPVPRLPDAPRIPDAPVPAPR